MNLVNVFNGQGVAPFSLGGQSKWTSMMWLEYLFDRIGGPEVFDAIYANKPDAWSDPAVIRAATKVQELVKANGFIGVLLDRRRHASRPGAAVHRQGSNAAARRLGIRGMKAAQPEFVASGLGFGNFPTVPGGKGDPKNTVGNPANYFSISSKATEEEDGCQGLFHRWLFTDAEVDALINSGQVPVVKAAESKLASSPMHRSCSSCTT